jgi:hypothetical protein
MDAGLTLSAPTAAAAIAALDSSPGEVGQVLALLRAAGAEQPEGLRVAAGDRQLLELQRAITGRELEIPLECGACGTVSAVLISPETAPVEAPRTAPLGRGGGLRAPTYRDLLDLPAEPSEAERELLRRCVVGRPARAPSAAELETIDDSLTGPVTTACVECGKALELGADVERLVLERLQRHAAQVEIEVHLLASTYGWSLAEIEALPDSRRHRLASLVADGR